MKTWRVSLVLIPLFVLAGVRAAEAGPIGYATRSHTNGHLFTVDLATGIATDLGDLTPSMGDDSDGLAFIGSTLYLVTGGTIADELWKIDSPIGPPAIKVGDTGPRHGTDSGLDSFGGVLYNISSDLASPSQSELYSLSTVTGAATLISVQAPFETRADGLAINGVGAAFAVDGAPTCVGCVPNLYSVNLGNGVLTLVGALGAAYSGSHHTGLAFDNATGVLWMTTSQGGIFTIQTTGIGAGTATFVAQITLNGNNVNGFEGLAIAQSGSGVTAVPEPATLALLGLGVAALATSRRRRV